VCEGTATIRDLLRAISPCCAWHGSRSTAGMRALLIAALVTVTVAVAGPAANAGTYIGLGVGTGASLSDSVNNSY
jgi:hypothetical protein